MKTKTILATVLSLALTASALATSVNASICYDDSTDLPLIEVAEIADLMEVSTPSAFKNFYIATNGIMEGLNTIITSDGNVWGLYDYGFYSESGRVWVVFDDHNTYDCTDDEIVEVFEAPNDDSEELFIYESVIEHIQTML